MKISEVALALEKQYRDWKKENGGHKTAPKGKYGFKSLQYKVVSPDGTVFGPFFGRGKSLVTWRKEVKAKGDPAGSKFLVEVIFKPKDRKKDVKVDEVLEFVVTGKGKDENVSAASEA